MAHAIVWFRDDLRLADNPALAAALDAGQVPVCAYVHAPHEDGRWAPGAASDAWRHRSLAALDADLRARGSRLRLFAGDSAAAIDALATEVGAEAVYWNRRHEPAAARRDEAVASLLRRRGRTVAASNGSLLIEPWDVETGSGGPYRVFTPFWRTARSRMALPGAWEPPARIADTPAGAPGLGLDALGLAPGRGWDSRFWDLWAPGEAGAAEALEVFVDGALEDYAEGRDLPGRTGTSRLSPHLHFGEIAPWRIVHALDRVRRAGAAAQVAGYVRELGWREFSHHVLHHFPRTQDHDMDPRFASFRWARPQRAAIEAWRRGMTGVPIVDAGMRELWHCGWMHGRVRMIVGSWLCKHMRQHWLQGARWFWDTLVDADLAQNSFNWQWVAGTGADAAPYFRVFNPVTQARRFDPDGEYIAHWLPELAALPPRLRHAPWTDPGQLATAAPDYPRRPIVDLDAGRDAALSAWRATRV